MLLLMVSTNSLHAQALQEQELLDSMVKELPKQKNDTAKMNMLTELSARYMNINPDEGVKYGLQSLDLATKMGWQKAIGISNMLIGMNYVEGKGDGRTALQYYRKSVDAYERAKFKRGSAAVLCNIGLVYLNQNDNLQALDYFLKALKVDEEEGFKDFAANVTGNIGLIYADQKDFNKALEYHLKAYKIKESLGDKNLLGITCTNIAQVYHEIKSYDSAINYYFKAIKLLDEGDNKVILGHACAAVGTVFTDIKAYTQAMPYFLMGVKIADESGDKRGLSWSYLYIGHLYVTIAGDTPGGTIPHAYKMSVKNAPDNIHLPAAILPNGKTALLNGAVDFLQRGVALAKETTDRKLLRDCYIDLAKAYELKGEYKMALDAANQLRALNDSVFSQENKDQVLKMTMKNEYDRQRLTDSLKVAEKEQITTLQLDRQKSYTYMGIAGVLLLAGFSFFIVKERTKSEQQRKIAENERTKSEGLLLNILPGEVAEELKNTGTTTAKHYNNVTVLFTDFVNFTHAGEQMSPQGLIDELHTCFKMFDEITHKYNIEKIKTIGDAYLAVCGLPTPDPNHAENVVRAASEINAFMADRLAKMGSERTFAVRIGIHSGSVVAGIVGVKKFAYDIWGDTVNTAARMEQNSEAGKINISEATYELVKDKFTCEFRGELEVKGKGVMKMYFASSAGTSA